MTGERQERPDPEVPGKARRRTFTAQYKLDVVAEYDAAAAGEKGAVLRREGLYSSHVTEWRRARGRRRGCLLSLPCIPPLPFLCVPSERPRPAFSERNPYNGFNEWWRVA